MLTAADPLPTRPQRVLVAGVSGAGKTTLAGRLAQILGLPYTEIDSLYHGPGWVPRTDFMSDVDRLTQEPGWVMEWQYRTVRRMLAGRADTLVWLDYRMPVTMSRLIQRTVRRRMRGEELWNGNLEGSLWTIFVDRDHIIRWGWRTRHSLRELVPSLESKFPQLAVVRLASPAELELWLRRLAADVAVGLPAGPVPDGDR